MGGKKRGLAQDQKIGWAFLAALVTLAAVALVVRRPGGSFQEGLPRPAPELRVQQLDGTKVALSDYSGKLVLLDFWATWCLECHEEVPTLISLHETFGPKDFTVLGVSLDARGAEVVAPFIKKNPVP